MKNLTPDQLREGLALVGMAVYGTPLSPDERAIVQTTLAALRGMRVAGCRALAVNNKWFVMSSDPELFKGDAGYGLLYTLDSPA